MQGFTTRALVSQRKLDCIQYRVWKSSPWPSCPSHTKGLEGKWSWPFQSRALQEPFQIHLETQTTESKHQQSPSHPDPKPISSAALGREGPLSDKLLAGAEGASPKLLSLEQQVMAQSWFYRHCLTGIQPGPGAYASCHLWPRL